MITTSGFGHHLEKSQLTNVWLTVCFSQRFLLSGVLLAYRVCNRAIYTGRPNQSSNALVGSMKVWTMSWIMPRLTPMLVIASLWLDWWSVNRSDCMLMSNRPSTGWRELKSPMILLLGLGVLWRTHNKWRLNFEHVMSLLGPKTSTF